MTREELLIENCRLKSDNKTMSNVLANIYKECESAQQNDDKEGNFYKLSVEYCKIMSRSALKNLEIPCVALRESTTKE